MSSSSIGSFAFSNPIIDFYFFVTFVGFLCSATTLLIIYDMGAWNGPIFLITLISIYQLIYDVSFYIDVLASASISDDNSHINFFVASTVVRSWSALTSTLISNVMMYSVTYMVLRERPYNLLGNSWTIFILTNVPSILFTILFSSGAYLAYIKGNDDLANDTEMGYCVIMILLISINLLAYFIMTYVLRDGSTTFSNDYQRQVIREIVARLKFYPIIQCLSQIGILFFELNYGWEFRENEIRSTQELLTFYAIGVTSPLASIGYFAIFLLVQPKSLLFLKSRLTQCKRYEERMFINANVLSGGATDQTTFNVFTETGTRMTATVVQDRPTFQDGGVGRVSGAPAPDETARLNEKDDAELISIVDQLYRMSQQNITAMKLNDNVQMSNLDTR